MNIPDVKQLLVDLIRINTVSPPGNERDLALFISSFLEERGIHTEIQDLGNNRANLIAEIGEGTDTCLVLAGHLDVVPAEGEWRHPPFSAEIEDNRIYGRGACDMKGGLAAMLVSFLKMSERINDFDGRLKLLFVADEETANLGILHYLKNDKKLCRNNLAIIAEPSSLIPCNCHFGTERFWINVIGKSSHSSKPEQGISAIEGAAEIIKSVELYHKELRTRISEYGSPSAAITLIEGGEKQNSLPASCRLFIDRRTVPGESSKEVAAELENWITNHTDLKGCTFSLEPYFSFESGLLSHDDPFFKTVLSLQKIRKGPSVFTAGCEQAIMIKGGYKTIVLGPGKLSLAHMPDEYIDCSELEDAVSLYTDLISVILKKKTMAGCPVSK